MAEISESSFGIGSHRLVADLRFIGTYLCKTCKLSSDLMDCPSHLLGRSETVTPYIKGVSRILSIL